MTKKQEQDLEAPEGKKRKTSVRDPGSNSTDRDRDRVHNIQNVNQDQKEVHSILNANGNANTNGNANVKFTKADFTGIGSFCRNAGSTNEGLETFLKKALSADSFAVSVMWSNKLVHGSLSSNHSTTTVKYCTPSVSCHTWHCTCDRHVRVQQAFEPLLGALILFPDEQQYLYFLPLAHCINPSLSQSVSGSNKMYTVDSSGNKNNGQNNTNLNKNGNMNNNIQTENDDCIPLNCQTTLNQRWSAFIQILLHTKTQKVIYNFQLAMLPIFAACYGLREEIMLKENFIGKMTLIENIFDPRVAAYVCETDILESDCEFTALCNKFNVSITALPYEQYGRVAVSVAHCHSELKGILQLKNILQSEIQKRDGCLKVFRMLEMPLVALLTLMELRGVEISQIELKNISNDIDSKIASIATTAQKLIGQQFNLASPEQVANILYDKLKLPTTHTSAKGRHSSTSEEDLQKIRTLHPVVDMILSFRTLSKVSCTYIAGLKPFLLLAQKSSMEYIEDKIGVSSKVNGINNQHSNNNSHSINNQHSNNSNRSNTSNKGETEAVSKYRVHANWNQTTVRTGRLSCCRPNLQNIPNKQSVADIDIVVRKVFRASKG